MWVKSGDETGYFGRRGVIGGYFREESRPRQSDIELDNSGLGAGNKVSKSFHVAAKDVS